MKYFLTTLLSISMLPGCAPKTIVDEHGRVVIHNFGYVKIVKPPVFPAGKAINVTGAELVGFSVGDAFTIGYKSSEFMNIPVDCRVLVVVKNAVQLQHLINEFSLIGEDEVCATISTKH